MDRKHLPIKSGVYYIKRNDKLYIGFATNIKARMRNHIYELTHNIHHSETLQRDWNESLNDFECGVIELTPDRKREGFWISEYGSNVSGYNIKIGNSHSTETKEKLSKSKKGINFSDEHKRKLSISHLGNTLSSETKNKMSRIRSGRNQSDAHIKNRTTSAKRNRILKTIRYYQDNGLLVPQFQIDLLNSLEA